MAALLYAVIIMSGHALTYQESIFAADQLNNDAILSIQEIKPLSHIDAIELRASVASLNPQMIVKLRWYRPNRQLLVGDNLVAEVATKPPNELANVGGFSYRRYLLSENIVATGSLKSVSKINRQQPTVAPISRFRQSIADKLSRFTRGDVLSALVIGDRSSLSKSVRQIFIDTGTAHLMAISGLHIGMVYGFTLLAFSCLTRLLPLPRSHQAQLISSAGAFAIAFCYAAISGFALPTIRALVFLALWLVVKACRWHVSGWRLLWFTAAVFITVAPQTAYSVSFWLSFSAVAGVFLALKVADSLQLNGAKKLATMQLVIVIMLMPVQVSFFNQQSLLAPLVNLFAIPWLGIGILPLALIGALASVVWPLAGNAMLMIADWQLQLMVEVLMPVANWQGQLIHMDSASLTLAIVGLVTVLSSRLVFKRWFALLAIVAILVIVASVYRHWRVAPTVDVLDVGQGLSVVSRYRGNTVIYDVGASYPSGFNMADAVINPYLTHQGIHHIDWLVLSHDDNDHAGSANKLSDKVRVNQLLASFVPDKLPANFDGALHQCHGQFNSLKRWFSGGISLQNLTSDVGQRASDNDLSCVVKMTMDGASLLLPGDISRAVEGRLNQQLLDAGLLIVPHHGSKTSSSIQFIKAVAPQMAVFSAGYRNRWHLPNEHVVQRYHALDVATYSTSDVGMGRFIAKGDQWQATSFCQLSWPTWYRCYDLAID